MDTLKKIIIAIDGYSSTGKSTLAKNIAKEVEYIYVDTGAMYRAVTLYAMKMGYIDVAHFNKTALISDLDQIHLRFQFVPELGYSEIYLNGINVEKSIRSIEVSNNVSQVSSVSAVRSKLVEHQKKMAIDKGIVMDGRDIGTVVFPDAELKFFMNASAEKRARRRFNEMIDDGSEINYESVLENVNSRDRLDTSRSDSPLVKADDAIEIDNSDMSVEETFQLAMKYVNERLNQ